jgi:acetylornithine/N-succinyldiaminopimelate aminotransferase
MTLTESMTHPVETVKAMTDAHIINTYGARRLAFDRGDGCRLWDLDGEEYLDCFAGIAVSNLGHNHPAVTAAITEQAAKLLHCSNLYYIESQARVAEVLSKHSFADKWFFCNSGAKPTKPPSNSRGATGTRKARRGRSSHDEGILPRPHPGTTVTATGQPKFQEGFEPLPPGFQYIDYGNIDALRAAMTPEVGAVMLEPIQGESGVRARRPTIISPPYATLCDKHGALMILDEVQTGIGRTGKFFAYEHAGIMPDIVTLAKGLANGVPIGAMGCVDDVAAGFAPGTHGSTFGGNFLATAAAVATCQGNRRAGHPQAHRIGVGARFIEGLHDLANAPTASPKSADADSWSACGSTTPPRRVIRQMLDRGICGPAGAERRALSAAATSSRKTMRDRVLREFEPRWSPYDVEGLAFARRFQREEIRAVLELADDLKRKEIRRRNTGCSRANARHDLRETQPAHAGHLRDRHVPTRRACRQPRVGPASASARSSRRRRNLERWVDGIMARLHAHAGRRRTGRIRLGARDQRAQRRLHPCQILADAQTVIEHKGRDFDGIKLAFVGDGNNVFASWAMLAAKIPASNSRAVCPEGYEPDNRTRGRRGLAAAVARSSATPPRPRKTPMRSTPTSGPAWARRPRPPGDSRTSKATRSPRRS